MFKKSLFVYLLRLCQKLLLIILLSLVFIFQTEAKNITDSVTQIVTQPLTKTEPAKEILFIQGWTLESKNTGLLHKVEKFFKDQEFSATALQDFLFKKDYYLAKLIQEDKNIKIEQAYQLIFIIKGNQFVKEKEIRKLLKSNKTSPGTFYNLIERSLQTFYKQKAFLNVKIKKTQTQKNWKRWVTIHIEEGTRTRLRGVEVKGLLSRPSSYYEKILLDSSPDIKKGIFNKESLEDSYPVLLNTLKSQGYLQSHISFDRIFFKGNEAFLILHLDEGPLTFITDIQIKGHRVFATWEILSKIKSRVQSTLDLNLLKQDLETIEKLYKDKGYYQMKILNKKNVIRYQPKEIDLLIEIEEGQKFLVSDIFLKGLKRVKISLVESLLKIEKDKPLTDEKKEKTLQALSGTGLFANVSINEKVVEDRLEVDILFQERKPRSIKGALGVNSQRGLTTSVYTEWTHRNLFGWGRAFVLKGRGQMSFLSRQRAFFEYDVSSRYKEIFSPGYGYEGDMNISQSRNIFFVEDSDSKINFVNKTLLSFFINKNLTDKLKLRWTVLSFENRLEDCNYADCPSNPQQITSTSFKLSWDKRDHIFNPKKGYLVSFMTEWASPYLGSSQNIAFLKADLSSYLYWTFLQDYTMGFVFKNGLISTVQGSNYLPVSRAFILGGQNSIRAYDGNIEGKRIPRKEYTPIETANSAFKLKTDSGLENILSSQYNLFRLDFRFPLLNNFKGLVFYDFGSVFLQSAKTNNKLDYGHSIGIGFRYQIFLIPIGLDIAFQLPPRQECLSDQCSYSRFHFAIGR